MYMLPVLLFESVTCSGANKLPIIQVEIILFAVWMDAISCGGRDGVDRVWGDAAARGGRGRGARAGVFSTSTHEEVSVVVLSELLAVLALGLSYQHDC